jgi:hypothetical protein
MPSDPQHDLFWIVMFTVSIGMVGLIIVAFLMAAWRRYNQRLSNTPPRGDSMPDIWQAGRDRLISKMSPYPRPDDGPRRADADDALGPADSDFDPFQDSDSDDDGEPFPGR